MGAYALERPDLAARMNVGELARAADVSAATVMRFCKSLGYEGFGDLRFALALDIPDDYEPDRDEIIPDDDAAAVAGKVFRADLKALQETWRMLDLDALARAVDALEWARHVQVIGTGASAPIALDAAYRLSCLGKSTTVATDPFLQVVSVTTLTELDLAFVISHTGRTESTLALAREAKAHGATVLGLSSALGSPLVELADVALVVAMGETSFRVGSTASRIAQISVVDALYVALANRFPEDAATRLEFVNERLETRRRPRP